MAMTHATDLPKQIEAIVDRIAKRVGRQPDLEARRDSIREAIAEAFEVTQRERARNQRIAEAVESPAEKE